jgi:hypothetical protein
MMSSRGPEGTLWTRFKMQSVAASGKSEKRELLPTDVSALHALYASKKLQ